MEREVGVGQLLKRESVRGNICLTTGRECPAEDSEVKIESALSLESIFLAKATELRKKIY